MSQDVELEELAFRKIELAADWMLGLARSGHYWDDYTKSLGGTEERDLMPVAEVVMCLTNLREYAERGVPQPPDDLIANVVGDLLVLCGEKGFSGVPYLISLEKPDPPFTDAVSFAAGALTGVLSRSLVRGDLKNRCLEQLMDCVNWLLRAEVSIPEDLGLKGAGWSWSSPAEIENNKTHRRKFGRKLPPQTYFTSTVFTTLCEVLFDLHPEVERLQLEEPIFRAVVQAKDFLLSTLFEENRFAGWADFGGGLDNDREKIQKLTDLEVPAWESQGTGVIVPMGEVTLYGLEPMSYCKYYTESDQYSGVVRKLNKKFPALMAGLRDFSDEVIERLSEAFSSSLFLLKAQEIVRKSCQIQVPKPLNEREGQKFCYYVDGTVGLNVLNVLNFFSKGFPSERDSIQEWRSKELWLVSELVNKSFKDRSFAHCGNPAAGEVFEPAIYATRTAIATLLSWGAQKHQRAREPISNEVRETIGRLYQLAFPGGRAGGKHHVDEMDPGQLLDIGYAIGLLLYRIREIDKLGKKELIVDISTPADKQTLYRENGRKLISSMKTLLDSEPDEVRELIDRLSGQRALARPYRDFLSDNKKGLESEEISDRVSTLYGLIDLIKSAVAEAGDMRFGEIFDGV